MVPFFLPPLSLHSFTSTSRWLFVTFSFALIERCKYTICPSRKQDKFSVGSVNSTLTPECDQVSEKFVVLIFACSFRIFTSKEVLINTNTESF